MIDIWMIICAFIHTNILRLPILIFVYKVINIYHDIRQIYKCKSDEYACNFCTIMNSWHEEMDG